MSIYHLERCRQEKGLVIQTNYIQIITEPKHCGSSTTPNKQEPSLVLKTSTSQSPTELQRKKFHLLACQALCAGGKGRYVFI